jgi:cell wall-associated NlpC family hydrolase
VATTLSKAAARTGRTGVRMLVRKAVASATASVGAGPLAAGAAALVALIVVGLVVLLLLGLLVAANTLGDSATTGPRGGPITATGALGLAQAAEQAGFAVGALRLAVAVGLAESSGNPNARNQVGPTSGCPAGSVDRGPWQINGCYHAEVSDTCAYDLACSAREVFRISSGGTEWTPWVTFTIGAYRDHLGAADAAIAALVNQATAGPAANIVLTWALDQLGTPYLWGGTGEDCAPGAAPGTCGFDCSGLVMEAYRRVGVMLPHNARLQYLLGVQQGVTVASDGPDLYARLQPGDLVFFSNIPGSTDGIHHVGLYAGDGQMVDAPHTGAAVRVESIRTVYWQNQFYGATRPAAGH